jgi:aryl-alcohol dehydrogenase-like predicted oxidoreductase
MVPIPGTTKLHRLEENIGAADLELTAEDLGQLDHISSQVEVQGARYPESAQRMINR